MPGPVPLEKKIFRVFRRKLTEDATGELFPRFIIIIIIGGSYVNVRVRSR